MYQEGNHTPSTKPIRPERVTLPSGNEIPNPLGVTGNELHDGAESGPVDRDGVIKSSLKTTDIPSDVRYKAPVGYYIQLHHNTEAPLDNEGLITNSICMSVSYTLMCHQMQFPSWVLHSTVV